MEVLTVFFQRFPCFGVLLTCLADLSAGASYWSTWASSCSRIDILQQEYLDFMTLSRIYTSKIFFFPLKKTFVSPSRHLGHLGSHTHNFTDPDWYSAQSCIASFLFSSHFNNFTKSLSNMSQSDSMLMSDWRLRNILLPSTHQNKKQTVFTITRRVKCKQCQWYCNICANNLKWSTRSYWWNWKGCERKTGEMGILILVKRGQYSMDVRERENGDIWTWLLGGGQFTAGGKGETGEIGIFGRDRRYSRDVREKEWGERNIVTGRRIVYSRREGGDWWDRNIWEG